MTTTFEGGCLCGAVRYASTSEPQFTGHCHCIDCRKSSGSGHCTHIVVPRSAFSVSGEARFYERAADSGNMISRGFCPNCGSALYSLNSAMPQTVFIRASSLDDPEVIKPQLVVYASRAPSWDHVDPTLPAFAEMPPAMPAGI
jgi:hypothetical protein